MERTFYGLLGKPLAMEVVNLLMVEKCRDAEWTPSYSKGFDSESSRIPFITTCDERSENSVDERVYGIFWRLQRKTPIRPCADFEEDSHLFNCYLCDCEESRSFLCRFQSIVELSGFTTRRRYQWIKNYKLEQLCGKDSRLWCSSHFIPKFCWLIQNPGKYPNHQTTSGKRETPRWCYKQARGSRGRGGKRGKRE